MAGDEAAGEDEDSREWRFALDEVGEDSGGEGVTGPWGPAERIEPQSIDLENAVFVILGVLLAVALIVLLLP